MRHKWARALQCHVLLSIGDVEAAIDASIASDFRTIMALVSWKCGSKDEGVEVVKTELQKLSTRPNMYQDYTLHLARAEVSTEAVCHVHQGGWIQGETIKGLLARAKIAIHNLSHFAKVFPYAEPYALYLQSRLDWVLGKRRTALRGFVRAEQGAALLQMAAVQAKINLVIADYSVGRTRMQYLMRARMHFEAIGGLRDMHMCDAIIKASRMLAHSVAVEGSPPHEAAAAADAPAHPELFPVEMSTTAQSKFNCWTNEVGELLHGADQIPWLVIYNGGQNSAPSTINGVVLCIHLRHLDTAHDSSPLVRLIGEGRPSMSRGLHHSIGASFLNTTLLQPLLRELVVTYKADVLSIAADQVVALFPCKDSSHTEATLFPFVVQVGLLLKNRYSRGHGELPIQLALSAVPGAVRVSVIENEKGELGHTSWCHLFGGDTIRLARSMAWNAEACDLVVPSTCWPVLHDLFTGQRVGDGFRVLESSSSLQALTVDKQLRILPSELRTDIIFLATLNTNLLSSCLRSERHSECVEAIYISVQIEMDPALLDGLSPEFELVTSLLLDIGATILKMDCIGIEGAALSADGRVPLSFQAVICNQSLVADPRAVLMALMQVRSLCFDRVQKCSICAGLGLCTVARVGAPFSREALVAYGQVVDSVNFLGTASWPTDFVLDGGMYKACKQPDAFWAVDATSDAYGLKYIARKCPWPGIVQEHEKLLLPIMDMLVRVKEPSEGAPHTEWSLLLTSTADIDANRFIDVCIKRAAEIGITVLHASACRQEMSTPYFVVQALLASLLNIGHDKAASDVFVTMFRDRLFDGVTIGSQSHELIPPLAQLFGVDLPDAQGLHGSRNSSSSGSLSSHGRLSSVSFADSSRTAKLHTAFQTLLTLYKVSRQGNGSMLLVVENAEFMDR